MDVHEIRIRIISRKEIKEEILTQLPFPKSLTIETATGDDEEPIFIYTILLTKSKEKKALLKKLNLPLNYLIKRVDENCNLFIRLNKEDFFNGKITPVESGDCVHIKTKIAAFPKKREIAIEKLKEIFI